jgi:hypothetical protein
VNWASKSPQQFLGLGLKTKWAMVVPQNQQEDEDDVGHASRSNGLLHLEASQARVPNLASRLLEAWHGWCTWHHHGGRVQMKLKMDRSMQLVASDSSMPSLPFSLY